MKAISGKKLTSREAARLLGVSEASVKRWADSGLLPMEKTAGGHRRFRPEDVARARSAGLHADGARAVAPKKSAPQLQARTTKAPRLARGKVAALVEETFGALLDGHDEELSALLVNLHLYGQTVGLIADGVLCPAMRKVGDLWHAGELSVAREHVATRTATNALRNLGAVTRVEKSGGALALCCSVEEDFHALPVQLAALTLEGRGVEVFDMGVSTPFSALAEALERFRPRLVCVSAALILAGLDRAAREYADFHKTARRRGAAVVLGGAGFADRRVRARFPADLHAENFGELEAFVGTLDVRGA